MTRSILCTQFSFAMGTFMNCIKSSPHIARATPAFIGVRDEFCSEGLKALARIFFPLLARISSGFARILCDLLPKNGYLKNSRGAAALLSPMARTPMPAFWWLLCGCVGHIARTKPCALSVRTVWYAVMISRSSYSHTVMQYTGSGDVDFFPPCNAKMGLS